MSPAVPVDVARLGAVVDLIAVAFVLAPLVYNKLFTVMLLVTALPLGSSTITSRSSPVAVDRAVNSEIFFALSAIMRQAG
jgi:hypothetical protein